MIRALVVAGFVALSAGCVRIKPHGAPVQQKTYESPEEASEDLRQAAISNDGDRLISIFGPDAKEILESGDQVSDATLRERFVQKIEQGIQIEKLAHEQSDRESPQVAFLLIGESKDSFPIALVKTESGWMFDTRVGKEEILNRRIGENELSVIHIFEELHNAQLQYARESHDGFQKGHYPAKFVSSPNAHDGLFWSGMTDGPVASLVKSLHNAGYRAGNGEPTPVYGYNFAILGAQGSFARGGARNFVTGNGRLRGGYALLAYPAKWGNSGVMTFMQGADGTIVQKNLGPDTASLASAIRSFNPDPSWHVVE